jgi:hypothetical protein
MVISGTPDATMTLVNSIVGHVKAELGCAVIRVIKYANDDSKQNHTKRAYQWLDAATVKMSLILTADDSSSISPNAVITQPFANAVNTFPGKASVSTAQSFSFGFGGGLSADANRKDTSDYSISVKDTFVDNTIMYTPGEDHPNHCKDYNGYLTDSDLQLYDWLNSRLFPLINNADLKDTPPQTLQTDITFTVTGSGNATPTWKLIPTSVNTTAPFFTASRKDTDEIIITISATAAEAATQQNIAKQGALSQPH